VPREPRELIVPADVSPQALETFVASMLPDTDRLEVRDWVKAGHVLVDGLPGKSSRYVLGGQRIMVMPPPLKPHEAEPQDLDLPIRYEDDHLLVVAKPAGMATHPGPGWWKGSCVNALLHAVRDWPGISGVAGPGIVHRLDRDTSGLLIFAKSQQAHQALLEACRTRAVRREYLAWVEGRLEDRGTIDAPLGRDDAHPERVIVRPDGKSAVTHWEAIAPTDDRSLLRVRLETGRNHQIRAHMASIGHPVWGDPVYGSPPSDPSESDPSAPGQAPSFMALHAWKLVFRHPASGEELAFLEPPPAAWEALGPCAIVS
jgi:23S rRNA pseudouridine1911/1915/1917 synthase